MNLDPVQWLIAIFGAFLIGLSKTGIQGMGVFAVALFALIIPARESVGVVLPILIAGDVVAVTAYRRHAVWSHVLRLLPWAAIGVVLGFLALGRIDSQQVGRLIGVILILLCGLQFWRSRAGAEADLLAQRIAQNFLIVALVGVVGGFTSMVANASGPLMIIYLLAMGLPKMEFVGTAAWYFLILNVFKLPFTFQLGLITPQSLTLDFIVIPAAIIGALFGRQLLKHINQQLFENLSLIFTLLAAIKLVTS